MKATKGPVDRTAGNARASAGERYVLEDQIGYVLRQVSQRHAVIFAELIGEDITPTQWAALAKLHEIGPTSQNLLGRLTSMDAATIKGVVQRLAKRRLVQTRPDEKDGRRLIVALTEPGAALTRQLLPRAMSITQVTLTALSASERAELTRLLGKMR